MPRLPSFLKRLVGRFRVFGELLSFLWEQRLWWLIPLVVVLVALGVLLVFAQSSAIAPFIYPLF